MALIVMRIMIVMDEIEMMITKGIDQEKITIVVAEGVEEVEVHDAEVAMIVKSHLSMKNEGRKDKNGERIEGKRIVIELGIVIVIIAEK